MHTHGAGATAIGRKRDTNEDCFLVDNDLQIFAVSDGMGGHAAGEVASKTAVEAVARFFEKHADDLRRAQAAEPDVAALISLAEDALEEACVVVYDLAVSTPGRQGMGATLTLLVGAGAKAVLAHVGDSRLYLARDDAAHLLSTDHTMAAELVRRGVLEAGEAAKGRFANVLTRAIGTQRAVQVDALAIDVLPGDRLLLCSDGFSEYIQNDAWLAERLFSEEPDLLPDELVRFANDSGGHDNITVVVAAVEADKPEAGRTVALASDVHVRLDAVESTFLFSGLTLAQLSRVLDAAEVESYEAGETILREGETLDRCFLVLDGGVAVSRGGKEISRLGPKDHVGEAALLQPRPAAAGLTALRPSRLLTIAHAPFHTLVKQRPWLGVDLLVRLGRHVCESVSEPV